MSQSFCDLLALVTQRVFAHFELLQKLNKLLRTPGGHVLDGMEKL